ncbi:hypothetical protein [Microbacterium gilvum]
MIRDGLDVFSARNELIAVGVEPADIPTAVAGAVALAKAGVRPGEAEIVIATGARLRAHGISTDQVSQWIRDWYEKRGEALDVGSTLSVVLTRASHNQAPADVAALIAEARELVRSWDQRGLWSPDSPVGMVMQLADALEKTERERKRVWDSAALHMVMDARAILERASQPVTEEQEEVVQELRVHYSYGVNHGTQTTVDSPGAVERLVQGVERATMGRVSVDKIERRTRRTGVTPWEPVEAAREAGR